MARRPAPGARDRGARALADRILLIIDGVYIDGAMLGARGPATAAVAFAEDVVRQSIEPSATVAVGAR